MKGGDDAETDDARDEEIDEGRALHGLLKLMNAERRMLNWAVGSFGSVNQGSRIWRRSNADLTTDYRMGRGMGRGMGGNAIGKRWRQRGEGD